MQTPVDVRQRVRHVLVVTLILNFAVAIGKIVVGLATGAISITADGFHSLMDGTSNVIGLVANRIAGKPPDEDHPYGHRRFETIAALAIGILLLITAGEIITSAIERLTSGARLEISPVVFAVLIATLVVNVFVSRYQRREGQRLKSELLIADAQNTGTDVFVTIAVLVSMVLVSLGLTWADPLAALLIVGLIARAAWQIMRSTGGVLVDTAPIPADHLIALAESVPSVLRVIRARSRGPADAVQIDLEVEVAPETTTDHAAAISDAIRAKLQSALEGVVEVEVYTAPAPRAAPDYALRARAEADMLGLATHEVRVADAPEGKILEMHVEVPPGQTLAMAHQQVSQLEQQIRENLPDVADVVTHIEPALNAADGAPNRALPIIERDTLELLHRRFPSMGWHHVKALSSNGGYALTMHVTMPADMTLEHAHQIAEDAELQVRTVFPDIERVTIHTEPPEPDIASA